MEEFEALDQKLREEFDAIGKPAKYGTAGFRDLAKNIPYVLLDVIPDRIQSRGLCSYSQQYLTFPKSGCGHVCQPQQSGGQWNEDHQLQRQHAGNAL